MQSKRNESWTEWFEGWKNWLFPRVEYEAIYDDPSSLPTASSEEKKHSKPLKEGQKNQQPPTYSSMEEKSVSRDEPVLQSGSSSSASYQAAGDRMQILSAGAELLYFEAKLDELKQKRDSGIADSKSVSPPPLNPRSASVSSTQSHISRQLRDSSLDKPPVRKDQERKSPMLLKKSEPLSWFSSASASFSSLMSSVRSSIYSYWPDSNKSRRTRPQVTRNDYEPIGDGDHIDIEKGGGKKYRLNGLK